MLSAIYILLAKVVVNTLTEVTYSLVAMGLSER